MRTIMLAACAAMALTGCASRAKSVAPVAVSSTDYAAFSCERLRGELQVAREREQALIRKQNNAAIADAASVLLVLLPLGSVFGAGVEGELAQAKGEVLAIERQLRSKCDAG